MIYLLDTDICIGLLRGAAAKAATKLSRLPASDVALCSVVIYELLLGAEKCNQFDKEMAKVQAFVQPFVSLPFDDECARLCAKIRAELERIGHPIGPCDYQIAAITKRHKLTLVTRNVLEFQRVPGLKVENWEN